MLKIKQLLFSLFILFGFLDSKIYKPITFLNNKGENLNSTIIDGALSYTQGGKLQFVGINQSRRVVAGEAFIDRDEVKVTISFEKTMMHEAQYFLEKIDSNGKATFISRTNYVNKLDMDTLEYFEIGKAHNNINLVQNNVAIYGDDRLILTHSEDRRILGISAPASILESLPFQKYGLEDQLGKIGNDDFLAISGLQDGLITANRDSALEKSYAGNMHFPGGLEFRKMYDSGNVFVIPADDYKVKYNFLGRNDDSLINPYHIQYLGSAGFYQDSFIVIQKKNADAFLIRDFGKSPELGEESVYKIPNKVNVLKISACGELTFRKTNGEWFYADANDVWSVLKLKSKENIDFYKNRTLLLDEKINSTLSLITEIKGVPRNLGQEELLQRLYQDYFACLTSLFQRIAVGLVSDDQISQALEILEKATGLFDGVVSQVDRSLSWMDRSAEQISSIMSVLPTANFDNVNNLVGSADRYKKHLLVATNMINDCVKMGNDLKSALNKHIQINSNLDSTHISKMSSLKQSIITKLINPNIIVEKVTSILDELKLNAAENNSGTALMQIIDSRFQSLESSLENQQNMDMWQGLISDLYKYSVFYGDVVWDFQKILCDVLIQYRRSENIEQWSDYVNPKHIQDFSIADNIVNSFNKSFSILDQLILNIEKEMEDNFSSDQKDLKIKLQRIEKRNLLRTVQQDLTIKSNKGILDLLSKANLFNNNLRSISRLKEVFPALDMDALKLNVDGKILNLESARNKISQSQEMMKQQIISDQNQVRTNLEVMVSGLGITSPESLTANEIIIAMMDRMYVMVEAAKRESEKIQQEALLRAENLAKDLAIAKADAAASLEATELASEEKTKELTGTINSLEQQMKENDEALRVSLAAAVTNKQELQDLLDERIQMVGQLEAQEKELKGYVDQMLSNLGSVELDGENESILEGFRKIVELKDKLIFKLKDDLEAAEKEAEELSKNLEDTTDRLNAAIIQKDELSKQNTELSKKNIELEALRVITTKNIEVMGKELARLYSEEKLSAEREKELGKLINLSNDEKKQLEKDIKKLEGDLLQEKQKAEGYEAEIAGNNSTIEDLKLQLSESQILNVQLGEDLKVAKADNDTHLETIKTLKSTHKQEIKRIKAEKDARIKILEDIETGLKNQLAEEIANNTLSQKTITSLNVIIEQKDKDYQVLEEQKQKEVDDLNKKMNQLEDDLTGQLDVVKGELADKKAELEKTRKDRDEALAAKQSLIDQLEGESSKAQNLLKDLLSKNIEGMSKLDFTQEEMSISDKITALEKLRIYQIGEIKQKYEAQAILMLSEITSVKTDKKNLQESLDAQKTLSLEQAAEIQRRIDELAAKESEYQQNLQEKEDKITTLKSDFKKAKKNLEDQLAQAESRNQDLEKDIEDLNKQLENKDLEIEAKEKLNQELSDANAIYEISLQSAQNKIKILTQSLDSEKAAKNKALQQLGDKIKELEEANENVDALKVLLQATIQDNEKLSVMKDSLISDLEQLNLKHQERIAYLEEREVVLTRKVEVLADVVESYVDFNELTVEEQEQLISVMGDDGEWVMNMLQGNVASTEKMLFDLFVQKYKKSIKMYGQDGLSEQLKNKINNLVSLPEAVDLQTYFNASEKSMISSWADSWTFQNELGEVLNVDDKTKSNLKVLFSSDSQAQILLIFEEQLKAVLEQKKAQLKMQQEAHTAEVENLQDKIEKTQKEMADAVAAGETRLEESQQKLLELEKEKNDKIKNQQGLIQRFGSLLDLYSQREFDLRQKEGEARRLRALDKGQVESLNYYERRYNNLSNKIARLEDLIETGQVLKTDVLKKLLDEQDRMDLNLYHSEYALPLALTYDENNNVVRSEFDVDIKYKTSTVDGQEVETFDSIQEIISGQDAVGAKEEIILGLEDEMTGEYFYIDPRTVGQDGRVMLSRSNNFDDSLKIEVVNQADFFVSFEFVKNDQRYRLSLVESTSKLGIPEQARVELIDNDVAILNYDLRFVPIAEGQQATENEKFYIEGLDLPVISQAVVIRANSNANYMHGFLAIKEDENKQKYLGYSQFVSSQYHSLFENYMQTFSVNRTNDQTLVRSILNNYIVQAESADKLGVVDSKTGFTDYDYLLQDALEKILENNPYLTEVREEVSFYKLSHLIGTLNEFAQHRISNNQFTPRDSIQLKDFAKNYLEKFAYSLWQDSYAYKCLFGINDEQGNITFEGLLNRGDISQLLSVQGGDLIRFKVNGKYVLQNNFGELLFSGTIKVNPESIFVVKSSEQGLGGFELLTYDGLKKMSLSDGKARLVSVADSVNGLKIEGTLKNPSVYLNQDSLVAVETKSGLGLSIDSSGELSSGFEVDVVKKDTFESKVINLNGGVAIYPILQSQLSLNQSTINDSLKIVLDYLRAYVTSVNSYNWVDQVSQIIRLINEKYLEIADPELVDQIEGSINLFKVAQDGEVFTIRRGTEYLCVQATSSDLEQDSNVQNFVAVFKNMPEGVDSSCLFKIYPDENNFERFAISGMHPNTKQYMYLQWNPADENMILGDVDTFAVTKKLPANINEQFLISGVGIDLKLATALREALSSKIVSEQNILTKVNDLTGIELSFERVRSHLVAFVNSPVQDLAVQLYYAVADIFDNQDLSAELKTKNCQKVVNDFYKMVVDPDLLSFKPFYSELGKKNIDADSEQMSLDDACAYILEDFDFNSRRREGINFTDLTRQELASLKLIASRNHDMSQLDQINLNKILNPQDMSFELFYSTYQNDNARLRIGLLNLAKFITGLNDLEFDSQESLAIVGLADLYARQDFPVDYANEIIAQIANLVDTQILGNTVVSIVEEEVDGEMVEKEIQDFTGNLQLVNALKLLREKLQNVLPVVQTVYSRDGMELYDRLELAENMLNGKYRDEQGNVKFEINTSGALEILNNITDEEINEMEDPIGYQEWKKYLKGLSEAMEAAKKSLETFKLDAVQSRSARQV